jgi:ATP-dependent RNA helicase DeaD
MTEFEGVVLALGQALTKRGYTTLTPVQEAVLAPDLKHADALVSAQTGSGKTVAFGLALAPTLLDGAERFAQVDQPLALVVAPTRELAMQVKGELQWLYEMTGASVASCVGGMDMRNERRALERGAHIVVGTPGRLRDHIERGSLDMTGLKAVVLDEADEMLDLGFREDLEFILDAAPSERRTLMFSATVPRSIVTLAKRYQRDAVRVATTAEREQHHDIEYRALTVAPNDRENAIINVLRHAEAKSALVFCATRATVNHMTSRFANRGFSVVALSGELSQNERSHALQAIRDGRARVCIATDVAARGIDLPNLELVIHADLPKNKESLLHRSGRTGRAGRKGVSTLIVPYTSRRYVDRLLSNANIDATWGKPPSVDDILKRDRERILDDPALSEPISDDERAFAQQLLAKHDAEQVAVALLRQHLAGQSAPEELLDAATPERRKKQHEDFKDGVWFSLSIGREQQAEPRWLLPMLCRVAHLTKRDIGAIRVHRSETHVELAPDCVDRFLEAMGPGRKVEKTISVTRLDGIPKPPDDARDTPRPRRKSRVERKPAPRPATAPETATTAPEPAPEVTPTPAQAPTRKPFSKPARDAEPAVTRAAAPTLEEKKAKKKKKKLAAKAKGKKPWQSKYAKSGTKKRRAAAAAPGSGDAKGSA